MLYIVFIVPLCSVYCNTLLANLTRAYLRDKRTTREVSVDLFRAANSTTSDIQGGDGKPVPAAHEVGFSPS